MQPELPGSTRETGDPEGGGTSDASHQTVSAAAIVGAWLILALTGAGRKPLDWFDRFSFLFSLFWVLWYLGRDFLLLLHSW
jgi:hypothetical protein